MLLDVVNGPYRRGDKHWMMATPEKFALQACIMEAGDGDYLEIGVNRGGSLCYAALVKQLLGQKGDVIGIEKAIGYEPEITHLIEELHLSIRPTVIYKPSDPWPVRESIRPVVAFIDGDHDGDAPIRDWNNLKDRVQRFILFHDDVPGTNDVRPAVENAKQDGNWRYVEQSGCMAIFERCGSS